MILVVGALEGELTGLKKKVNSYESLAVPARDEDFFRWMYTGVGKLNAAVGLGYELAFDYYRNDVSRIDAVVNVGLSGSLAPDLIYGDIVTPDYFWQGDVDLTPFDLRKGETLDAYGSVESSDIRASELYKKFDDPDISYPDDTLERLQKKISKFEIRRKDCMTNDQFITDGEKYPYECIVDMETFAYAKVCKTYRYPFFSFRMVSDNADENAHDSFQGALDGDIFIDRMTQVLLAFRELTNELRS